MLVTQEVGVGTDNLLVSQPDFGGTSIRNFKSCIIRSGAGDLVVVDSVAALTPRVRIDGEYGWPAWVGVQARTVYGGSAENHWFIKWVL